MASIFDNSASHKGQSSTGWIIAIIVLIVIILLAVFYLPGMMNPNSAAQNGTVPTYGTSPTQTGAGTGLPYGNGATSTYTGSTSMSGAVGNPNTTNTNTYQ